MEKNEYEHYMEIAILEGEKASSNVSPNPMVGAVIVKNGEIIGKGYHEKYGENHAEINAIKNSKCDLSGSTIYVTLEPCFHYGKTPPCVDAIINSKITKVVIGAKDPNPEVCGKSIEKLKKNGIEVVENILKEKCEYLSRFFMTNILKKKPHIILKVAKSKDGFISTKENTRTKITSIKSDKKTHLLRSKVDAVLVGANTVRIDNPFLTVRHVDEKSPIRLILSKDGNISKNSNVFIDIYNEKTILLVAENNLLKVKKQFPKIKVIGVEMIGDSFSMKSFLSVMIENDIFSILVEGGNKVWRWFLDEKVVDEIWEFIGSENLENCVKSELYIPENFEVYDEVCIGLDKLKIFTFPNFLSC